MKPTWPLYDHVPVTVVNESLDVAVKQQPFLINLFESKEVPPHSSAMGPLGGIDFTGYSEYRLILHFAGAEGTEFSIEELFGPAGGIDQISFEVGAGQIGAKGVLNYRAKFDIFGPKNVFIQVSNKGESPFQVNGTLYAVS
jgi:hypothetical protein